MAYKRVSPMPVVEGGTGAQTLTVHGVLVGESTSAINATTAGTTGQVLIGSTGADPSFAPLGVNSSLTSNGVLLGNNNSAITATAAGTTGQVLTGVTGSAPTFQTVGSASITITGDSGGGLTGSSFTLTGGTTGLTFAGAGTTETLGGDLVVANGGTGVATLTNHGVVLGQGTSAVHITAAGTAGQVLVSGGAAADPGYVTPTAGTGLTVTANATTHSYTLQTPVTVANGGTGKSSLTAFAVLCGGTTTTGAIQSIASVGTTGQVLTSNGAGALPTFQAASGGVTTIAGDQGAGATGSTVTIKTGYLSGPLANGTPQFIASGSTSTLQFTDSVGNTAIGTMNAAFGFGGTDNTGLGDGVLTFGGSGNGNTAIGNNALGLALSSGSSNVAVGVNAASQISSGSNNVAIGNTPLGSNGPLTGSNNIAVGHLAGSNYATSESNNIVINNTGTVSESNALHIGLSTGTGAQQLNSAFIAGITGITVTGTAVLISTGNQLGVAVSSERFKKDIQFVEDSLKSVYDLQPVHFTWNQDAAPGLKDAPQHRVCGLIAEEVYKVIPELVNLDSEGKPFNINYTDLIPMLLNEIQKLAKRIELLEAK